MPYVLFFLCLLLGACGKKSNIISTPSVVSTSEQRSFIVIAHEKGSSVFRNKALNSIVETKFPSNNPNFEIKKGDELLGYDMSERDRAFYEHNERTMAKVIVSFTDRLEIYFVPRKVAIPEITSQLKLTPEAERKFKLINPNGRYTEEGNTLYLISVNYEDLMENDKKFYQENFDLQDLKERSAFYVESYKEMVLSMSYEFFKERDITKLFTGPTIKCSRDLIEAGTCGRCEYKKSVPSGNFDKIANPSLDDLGVGLKLDGETIKMGNLTAEMLAPGSVVFHLAPQALDVSVTLKVELEKKALPTYRISENVEELTYCASVPRGYITLASKSSLSLKVKMLGRGEKLKDVKL